MILTLLKLLACIKAFKPLQHTVSRVLSLWCVVQVVRVLHDMHNFVFMG